MKRYGSYKATKYTWLTEVPSHWKTQTLRSLTTVRSERRGEKEATLLSVYREYGVIIKSSRNDNHNVESEDLSNYKVVHKGDLVMNKMKMWQGSLGISNLDGVVSPAYIVCHINDATLNLRYLHTLLRSPLFKTYYNQFSYGVRVGQWDMHYEDFKGLEISIPPRDEQDQIVRYLDWQVSKINRLIAAKQKQIELTREYALAKIEDVFNTTIGTDSDNIPIGRHIRKIESGTSVNSIIGTADKETPGVLSTSCVYGNHFDASQNKRVEPADYERVSCPVRKNTVIVSRMNTPALVGACGFSDKDIDNVFLPDRLWQVYFDDTLMSEFVWRYLSRPRAQAWFATIATGSSNTMKNITKPQFKAVLIPNVPSDMQRRIIKSISKITDERDTACQLYEQTISTLQALRTRLISDVVTGQIDVRGIEVPNYEHYDEAPENATEESSDSDYDTEE